MSSSIHTALPRLLALLGIALLPSAQAAPLNKYQMQVPQVQMQGQGALLQAPAPLTLPPATPQPSVSVPPQRVEPKLSAPEPAKLRAVAPAAVAAPAQVATPVQETRSELERQLADPDSVVYVRPKQLIREATQEQRVAWLDKYRERMLAAVEGGDLPRSLYYTHLVQFTEEEIARHAE